MRAALRAAASVMPVAVISGRRNGAPIRQAYDIDAESPAVVQMLAKAWLELGDVERAESLTDGHKVGEHASVATIVDAMFATGDDPTGPQGLVSVGHDEGTPGKVPRRSGGECEIAELDVSPPVTLDNTVGWHVPVLKVGTNAERHNVKCCALAEFLHGAEIVSRVG